MAAEVPNFREVVRSMMYETVWEAVEKFPGSWKGKAVKIFKHIEGWDERRVMFYLKNWALRVEDELEYIIENNDTAWGSGWWDKRTVSVYQIGTRTSDMEYKIEIEWALSPPDNVFDTFYQNSESSWEEEWEAEYLEQEKEEFD